MWRHIAQCVIGVRHRAEGAACQDACAVRVLGTEPEAALIACVADGAGDSSHGDRGAEMACQSIMDSAADHFASKGSFAGATNQDVVQWCEAARNKIEEQAKSHNRNLREYATTLCAAIVSPRGSLFFQIGDGAMIARKNSALGVVFWPQSGEYINTTNFLTSHDFRNHLDVFISAESFSEVALLTDGIERLALKFDSFTPHPPFFDPLLRAVRDGGNLESLAADLRQLLQSDFVRSKTDDDKTLVLAAWVRQQTSAG